MPQLETLAWKQILCPVDFSSLSADALRFSGRLSEATGAAITVVHAALVEVPPYFTSGQLEEIERQLRGSLAEAEKALLEFARAALGERAIRTKVVEASAVEGIREVARQIGADVIVMGTHGRGGVNRLLMGSVAERTLRESRIPVVTVRGGAAQDAAVRRLLCPVNDSETARLALSTAVGLAQAFQAELIVAHIEEEPGRRPVPELCAGLDPEQKQRCRIQEVLRTGNPAEEIIRLAQEASCDLLVIGAEHKKFFDATVIGTTTARVVRHAPCPVLTVPYLGK